MLAIDIRADLKPLQKAFVALHSKQVPFAISVALNALAKGVAGQERALIDETFDSPTPFTENAYRIGVATKSRPIATVAAKDIQAQYLEPYVDGGLRFLGGKKAMLAPRGVNLNQYGNIPRVKLASLKGKPNVFIGAVKTKSGRVINGVWQRSGPTGRPKRRALKGTAQPRAPLKLLIDFEDTSPVTKKLDFYGRAAAYIKRNAPREFQAAMRKALATAR